MLPVYRLATEQDIAQLTVMRMAMQKEVKTLSDEDIHPAAFNTIYDYFKDALRAGTYIGAVAEAEGSIVAGNGVVFYRRPPSLTGGSGLIGYVTNVYTLPQWRKRGIARNLLRFLIQEARTRNPQKLHLGATEAGRRVYEEAGFCPLDNAYELKLA